MNVNLNRLKVTLYEQNKTCKYLVCELGVNLATVSKRRTKYSQRDLYSLNRVSQLLQLGINCLLTGNGTVFQKNIKFDETNYQIQRRKI